MTHLLTTGLNNIKNIKSPNLSSVYFQTRSPGLVKGRAMLKGEAHHRPRSCRPATLPMRSYDLR